MLMRRVRALRALRSESQAQLAERMGIDRSLFSMVESGRVLAPADMQSQIKEALGWPAAPLDALAFAILEGEIADENELVTWLDQQGIVHLPTVDLEEMIRALPFAEPPDPAA